MDEYHQRPQCRIRRATINDQIYTRHGIKREPFGRLFVEPRWTSETTLIAHETLPDGWLINPYSIDLKRHRSVIQLPALSRHIVGSRGAAWQVSPDNRWVLWPKGSPDPNSLCATRIDGSKQLSFAEASHWGKFFGWLPGNHPVYLTSATSSTEWTVQKAIPRKATAFVYDLRQSRPIQHIPLPPLEETEWAGVSPSGTIVLVGLSAPNRATLAQIRLSGGTATLHRTTISLPVSTDEEHFGVTLSPEGRRLLWRLGKRGASRLAISSLEGERFTRLRVDAADDLQWLPSGKAISFQKDEDLYTLEVG